MTPSSRPAVAITILKMLPGAYCPWITRFMRGVAGSVESRPQRAASTPVVNWFGS